jgi:hypothetical protein
MTGKDVERILEDRYVFLIAGHHDCMYGLIWHERLLLLIQARGKLVHDWIILTLFFAHWVGLRTSTDNFLDGIAGLGHGATETDGKDECNSVEDEGVADEQELGKDWVVAPDEAWRIVETDDAGLDYLEGAFCYDQDRENRETWETANNPVEDGHVCRSWQYGGRVFTIVCIGVD